MKKFVLYLLLTVIISCSSSKETSQLPQAHPNTREVIIDRSFTELTDNAPVTIKEIQFDGDIMEVDVTYSGGCEEHIFELYTDGRYSDRYPPQLKLYLKHNNMNDNCRTLVSETLYFNVSDLQYAGTNAVMLRFNDLNKSVKYAY